MKIFPYFYLSLSVLLSAVLLPSPSAFAQGCERVWRNPDIAKDERQPDGEAEKTRRKFIENLQKLLQKQKWNDLYEIFHPQLQKQMSKKRFRVRMGNLVKIYGKRPQVTNFRSWRIKGTEGDPKPVACADSNLHVFPTYGFGDQLSLWLQILGDEDVGRYFVQAAIKDGSWRLTLVHVHQWTHGGIDGPAWVRRGVEESNPALKYLYLDLGFKLAMSNPHVIWPGRESLKRDVLAAKQKAGLSKALQPMTDKVKLRDISSAFNRKGLGLTAYLEFTKETSKSDRKEACKEFASALAEKQLDDTPDSTLVWLEQIPGIQCVFVYPRHKELRPNKLGTYQASVKVRKKPKKRKKKKKEEKRSKKIAPTIKVEAIGI